VLTEGINKFPNTRVAIVGDLVADQFLNGKISRVSREAPVFILRHDETETRPGGAANAAANVAALGGTPLLVGIVGDDPNGLLLKRSLETAGVVIGADRVIEASGVQTTTKVRVLAGQHYAARQQVIRIDYENREEVEIDVSRRIIEGAELACRAADAIVVSDYGYGVVTEDLLALTLHIANERGIPMIVDSRFRLGQFPGATSATPNQEEAEQILGKDLDDAGCKTLRERLSVEALLITRGNKGMTLVESGREPMHIGAVGSSEPVDVTGAGDTVIAAYTLGLAAGMTFADAAAVANHAGGIVVMKKGTATAKIEELRNSIETYARAAESASPFN
jgi:D-glycero-beta-D-manno-heptose-7-phosphate kinase